MLKILIFVLAGLVIRHLQIKYQFGPWAKFWMWAAFVMILSIIENIPFG